MSSPASPFDAERFEARLEQAVRTYRSAPLIAEMLAYHFGFGAFAPARRGKRLRPQMVLRVAVAQGAAPDDALDAAAAIEMLHNYSLIHDDIEDGDELRHGRQTLWSAYGLSQAINAGDALCAATFLTLAQARSHHPAARVLEMIAALHEAHGVMCEGQSLDLAFEQSRHVGVADYEHMISAKTASLFGAACRLGALCGACDQHVVGRYSRLGSAYGMAFQIRDDVLGIWASSDATGKTRANDIARRKWTFPIVWALATKPSAARAVVEAAYRSQARAEPEGVQRVVDALDELGARGAAEEAIARYVERLRGDPSPEVGDFFASTLAAAQIA